MHDANFASQPRQSDKAQPRRAQRLDQAEEFDAATKIVGKYGYAEASVARITEAAGVAQGTFYNHYENRQELLDQLLPKIGMDMVQFIRKRTGTAHAARQEIERPGIRAADARGNGLYPRDAHWSQRPTDEKLAQQHVLIVGAGVCAIALGVALGRLGIPYTIVEKNAELGGTWYVNRYPGCGVDTPNHSYSFSFGPRNPWTRYFAQRAGTARLSQESRVGIRHSKTPPIEYGAHVVVLG